jgi:hypothetical protein
MGPKIILVVALLAASLAGCGSISFFPAAPAQRAADKVIDDIWPAAPLPPAFTRNVTVSKESAKELAKAEPAATKPANTQASK